MDSWNQSLAKSHKSEHFFHPVLPPKITIQSDNMRDKRRWRGGRHKREDLSRDDLLFLLSILEGELQARDEVITVLKSEMTDLALVGAHYGFSGPDKVLRALQRDSLQAQQDHLKDVYEIPIAKVNQLLEAQKRSSKLMLEQLAEVSRSHSGALNRLEKQERSHRAFIHRSNCLTTLLEEDRERLVHQTLAALTNTREITSLTKLVACIEEISSHAFQNPS